MGDISLLEVARSLHVSSASGIVVAKGQHWPPPPTVSIRALLLCSFNVEWINYMQTLSLIPASICTVQHLDDIIALINDAERNQQQVHAYGSKWSFSDCATGLNPATLRLIDTTLLKQPIQTVQGAMISGDPTHVYHVQAGITIQDLYTKLDAMGLALESMGGSSGQTLAGAISTGTHGGDLFMAPLANSVLAIHLVGVSGTQYWIEPSPGITDPILLRKFVLPDIDPKNIIYDHSWFGAALVSLGCMGIIYAVVLRVRDQYNLTETTTQTTWQAFMPTAAALLNNPNNRFLQIAIDPYPNATGTNTCLVTTRTEGGDGACTCAQGDVLVAALGMLGDLSFANPLEATSLGIQAFVDFIHGNPDVSSVTSALATVIDAILAEAPDLRSVLVRDYGNIMLAMWPPGTCGGKSYCVMDSSRRASGSNTSPGPPPTPGLSIEMFFQSIDINGGMPWVGFVNSTLATINAATNTFLTGYVSLRFSGLTRACLGMQRFSQNCSVEISVFGGAHGQVRGEFALLTMILDSMYALGGLPHWGQLLDLPGGVQGNGNLYPRFKEWRAIYGHLSNNFTQRTFENSLSRRWQRGGSSTRHADYACQHNSLCRPSEGSAGAFVPEAERAA